MANDKKVKNEKKHFFKDFKTELKKVTWPTGKQLVNNTIAVITIVAITAAIVFVLDLGFETLNKHGINRLKSAINNQTSTAVEENNNNATPETTANEEANNGQDNTNVETTPSPEAQQ